MSTGAALRQAAAGASRRPILDSLPIAAGDIAILIILAISAFLALARGFVAEVLSIAGWLGAALVTLWTFNDARPYLRQYIEMQLLADILTGVGIFVVALVIFSTISHLIARVVKGSALSAVDRSLGFAFGVVRGAVLVCLAYLLLTWVFPETRRPPWLENARMLPWVQAGAEYLKTLVPQEALAGAIDKAKQEAPALTPKEITDPIGSLLNQNQPPAPANTPAQPQPAQPPASAPPAPGITPTHPTQTHPAPPSNAGATGGG
ncbi:CvpA family protein [Mycobacterium sp. KBS0706]|uniref:CvpA family protein n=1 Tax=Mycobacterium sp. KBS0706 TaxID=2578109 RepID=UPI00110F9518|nr:CvpA family protein [Mycobacterium sp. KBS0706]TSD88890.1 CvpA family protein [Mycobacterium sp. KBS0706]